MVATVNLYRRFISHSRCGGLGVALNAPKQMQPQEAMRGNRGEAMTSNYINPHKS